MTDSLVSEDQENWKVLSLLGSGSSRQSTLRSLLSSVHTEILLHFAGISKTGTKKNIKHIKMIKKVMCTVIYQRRLFFHTSLPPSTPYTSSDLSMMKTHPSNCKKSRCYRFKDLYAQSHLQQISIFKNRHFVLSLTLNSANLSMFLDVFLKRENSPLFSQNDFFMLSKTWGFISHDKNSRNKNV